jgi:Leucine-rich repeat (LRR) protein
VEVDMENNIIMHDHLRDLGRDLAKEPALPRRLWRGIENNDDFMHHSSGIIDMRGIRLFHSEYKDEDSEQDFFSRYKIWKLQLLDVEILMEHTLSGVHSPNLIWLRWHECHLSCLPSWIPMKNLWVLEVHGTELKTLWPAESQIPSQLRELQIVAPLSNIPKSIGKLQHLERIVVDCPLHNKFEELPEEIGHLRLLKTLVLKGCSKMKSLPNSIGNLTQLEHIDLSYCMDLERLPNSFKNLIRLRYLDLSCCFDLTISNETLGKIGTLKYIDLSYCNKIEVLPSQVAHQRSLEKLNLKLLNLKELPSDIGELRALEELELESPLLETLPPSIGDLRSLKYLVLRRCPKLKCLADSIGLLNQLTKLTVQDCSLLELPFKTVDGESETLRESKRRRRCSNLDSSIDKCMLRLQHLELYNTQKLDEVSFGEGVCPHLQHLLIKSCNDLAEVGTLPNALITLELTWCSKLRKIEGLCGLANLQKLDIKGCIEVEVLPGFETLVSLEVLEITNCVKLKSIRGLEQLSKLRKLEVSSCSELEDLPSVENLRSLQNLDVSDCVKLRSIQGLAQLTKLRTLKVRNCSELEELAGIENLRSLEMLEAFNCVKLKSILGLEQLTALRKLEVSNCFELEDMPGVENLRSLKKLDVFGCVKLKRVQELAQLTKLEGQRSAKLTKLRRRALTQLTKLHRLD